MQLLKASAVSRDIQYVELYSHIQAEGIYQVKKVTVIDFLLGLFVCLFVFQSVASFW